MMRSTLLACALGAVCSAACGGAVIEGAGIGAEDASLLAEASTLVFSFSSKAKCKDLVDLNPSGIGDKLQGAPLQLVDLTDDEADDPSYTFGKVPPDEEIAYLVLLSAKEKGELGDRAQFSSLDESVFAIGCRDFAAQSGTRHDLPITVFAAGLR
jgi:hypothetical protein